MKEYLLTPSKRQSIIESTSGAIMTTKKGMSYCYSLSAVGYLVLIALWAINLPLNTGLYHFLSQSFSGIFRHGGTCWKFTRPSTCLLPLQSWSSWRIAAMFTTL